MSKEEERKEEGEASPHPRLEALCGGGTGYLHSGNPSLSRPFPRQSRVHQLTYGEIHSVSLAQGPQAVQTPALIVILQELHKAWVAGPVAMLDPLWATGSLPPRPLPSKETHSGTWRKIETGSGTSGT